MKYLYTMKDCGGCETARSLLEGQEFTEVPLDNPLVEVGVKVLFRDGLVHAPILVEVDKGIYYLIKNEWVLLQNLSKSPTAQLMEVA